MASVRQATPVSSGVHALQPSPTDTGAEVPLLVQAAVDGAAEMSAERIVALDVGDVLAITDWFIIASAPNARRVRRIAELMEAHVKAAGGPGPLRTEGLDEAHWVLLDFGEFVAHIFHEPSREYYDLERLWSDVPRHEFG
ncbi:MAG: ribosome silencing factor [Acidimicrobiales bacterium]|nr:ribosome silencing factor [Acidimicrobiales bacterium]MYD83807.1 ribosome silencing factor [Acidimicrobiales bacterium]MYJ65688.1 ribosome silencing factor [Acidimicrobiales bacterium]